MKKGNINRSRKKNKNTEPELNEQTMKVIEKVREQIKQGKFLSMEEVKKRLGP
jgi:hypothetical protein